MSKFYIKKLTNNQKGLRKRILEISYKRSLSHLGSCLTAVDAISAIYRVKKPDEKFVLSNGHSAVAWYAVLEANKYLETSSTNLLNIHPDRSIKNDIHVSTGSLGQGLPIALGMAISDKTQYVYCMISDGEATEGSIWEALRVTQEKNIYNLKIIINANGWSAYDKVNTALLVKRLRGFGFKIYRIDGHDEKELVTNLKKMRSKELNILLCKTISEQFPFLQGLDAHYYVMSDLDYEVAIKKLT